MNAATMEEIVIIDDDIIIMDDEEDDGFQITSWNSCAPHAQSTSTLTPTRLPSRSSLRETSDDESLMFILKPGSPVTNTRKSLTEPQFRTPNYGARKSHLSNRNSSLARSPRSQPSVRSFPGPATCLPPFNTAGRNGGTLNDPIALDSHKNNISSSTVMQQTLKPPKACSSGESSRRQQSPNGDTVLPDADLTVDSQSSKVQELSTQQDSAPSVVQNMEVIDLDALEDDLEDELRILAVQNIHPEEDSPQAIPKPTKLLKLPRRSPSIVTPWTTCPNYQHDKLLLKSNKTVELLDGDFLRIRDIIFHAETKEIRIRGNRLQRTRDLNGLLERKMNELVLFLEVDLDDPRPHLEQAAVEIPLTEIKKIRSLRLTNHKFPHDRNLDPNDFRNRDHIGIEGGLTCRWKYTCTYTTGADRYHNNHTERRIERLRANECTSTNALSDAERRMQWRGETIPGGAYQTLLAMDETLPITPKELPISVESSPGPENRIIEPSSLQTSLAWAQCQRPEIVITPRVAKRKRSADETPLLEPDQELKRPRYDLEPAVEEARRRLSTCTLDGDEQMPTPFDSMAIDVAQISEDIQTPSIPSQPIDLSREAALPLPTTTNPPTTSSLAVNTIFVLTLKAAKTTISSKSISSISAHLVNSSARLILHLNYHESAHDFVSRCQHHLRSHPEGSKDHDKFKVDILHLSPPCQFFSPAHTVNGQDDEMNVASLFAVQSVIEVARPRVVTLEQTFGIVNERFRWFFNALVQMFTMHEFSVRWAVIPLQSWGLPQRRMRLIIIASCPGEILPSMPYPTNAENPAIGSGLKPHRSVHSVLTTIPNGTSDHDPLSVQFAEDRRMHPWDSSRILPRAMTTSGGQNYHPSGMRDFTLREYACLQGFPLNHVFRGNYVKKQIGNAVPPVVAKVLFESIRRDLDRADGIVEGVEVLE
ncbi:uncharacterized protein PAC_01402 [Phialocephala subalpina]|uniref:DNA (cytosine-5-)-methyltransferase n=1 Tax=Phialocephala subalpina TaxID=576137 RepID=A0A1L7WFI8_9HELO|nr:uncharacterized protein PAC_01402 [Phialocephala subalpina]